VGDGYIRVQGVITNLAGMPLPNATVSIEEGSGLTHSVTAGDTGCFELGITAAPYRTKYRFSSSLPGFRPLFFTAHSAETTRVRIVLSPESSRGNGSVTVEAISGLSGWGSFCATPSAPRGSDLR
jgi:hypothetical protein